MNGNWISSPSQLEYLVTTYFPDLFTRDSNLNPEEIVALFESKVSVEMNERLCREFTDRAISDALFQIGPLKAPGTDGFPVRFYQRNWGIMKEQVIASVKIFFATGKMPANINHTAIVLIPKVDQPMTLKEFRPISLCKVLYKVIAKCLANRLRPILGEIISINQSAFVPGRLITDNALVAFECFHFIEQNKNPEKNFCAYKIDLSKAYDHVDWGFLEQVMQRLGFSHRWIDWIMACVTSVRYSIKLNGTLLDSFAPSRGLRQGDPLSPFLFLFVADGLSAILKSKVQSGDIVPVKICRRAPGISHLLFADDTMLFFQATRDQAEQVKAALDLYSVATGQSLNYDKCSIFFGEACPAPDQEQVRDVLKVKSLVF